MNSSFFFFFFNFLIFSEADQKEKEFASMGFEPRSCNSSGESFEDLGSNPMLANFFFLFFLTFFALSLLEAEIILKKRGCKYGV